jgi:prepilin-type N-terminal cleavage/methylation domain-containing protein
MKRLHNSRGFTLIELIMVIVILGILAAVAIPRFMDLQDDAKKASEKGVAGGVRAGITTIHAAFLMDKPSQAMPAVDTSTLNDWPDALDNLAADPGVEIAALFSFVIEGGTALSDNWSKETHTDDVSATYKGPWGNGGNDSTWTYYMVTAGANPAGSFTCDGTACP